MVALCKEHAGTDVFIRKGKMVDYLQDVAWKNLGPRTTDGTIADNPMDDVAATWGWTLPSGTILEGIEFDEML